MSWFGGKQDAQQLIARRNYHRAMTVLEEELEEDPGDVHTRQLLADVCVHVGDDRRAVRILDDLAAEFAAGGFVSKAVAILKRIQRIAPDRSDIGKRLESIAERKEDEVDTTVPLVRAHLPDAVVAESPDEPAKHREGRDEPAVQTSIELELSEGWLDDAETQESIHGSPYLDGLTKEELSAMVRGMRLIVKNPGAIVFSHGEPADGFFVLASGYVRVYRKGDDDRFHQSEVLQDGDVFGESSVLGESTRAATVTAAVECELLELGRQTFERIVHEHPRVLERLLEVTRRRRREDETI